MPIITGRLTKKLIVKLRLTGKKNQCFVALCLIINHRLFMAKLLNSEMRHMLDRAGNYLPSVKLPSAPPIPTKWWNRNSAPSFTVYWISNMHT